MPCLSWKLYPPSSTRCCRNCTVMGNGGGGGAGGSGSGEPLALKRSLGNDILGPFAATVGGECSFVARVGTFLSLQIVGMPCHMFGAAKCGAAALYSR
jgi:hypothetical protein